MAYTGTGASLQIGKESAWGSAAAGAKNANITSESIKLNANKVVEDTLIASVAPSSYMLMGLDASGDFSGILKPENAGYLLHLAVGGTDTVSTNTPVSGAHTHSIVAATASGTLPSFTAIVDRRAAVVKYSGCKIDTFTLEAAAADFVKYTASIKAKDESTGSLAGLSALALASFKTTSGTFTIGGSAHAAKSVKITIANKLEDIGQTYGSGLYKGEPIHGTREITLEMDLNYETATETINTTNYQTDVVLGDLVLTLYSTSMVTGTTPYSIVITIKNAQVTGVVRNVSGAGVITSKVTAKATSVSTTAPITVAVVDGQTAAYSA